MRALQFGAHYSGSPEKAEVVAYAQRLEQLGFEGFWCTDGARGRDPLPLLAAAGAVSNLDLGTAVLLIPFRDPTILARQVATLDVLSGGKVILGVGVGGERPADFGAYGVDPKERGPRANEALRIILKLWHDTGVTDTGRFYSVENTTIDIKPVQKPHPPIWIGGRLGGQGASRDAGLRRLARFGDGWLPYLVAPEQYAQGLERLSEYTGARNRDPDTIRHACQVYIGIYDTREEAVQVAMDGTARGYGLNEGQVERLLAIGTVDQTIARLKEYVDAGVEYFVIQWACRQADVPRNLELLSKEVLPAVKQYAAV